MIQKSFINLWGQRTGSYQARRATQSHARSNAKMMTAGGKEMMNMGRMMMMRMMMGMMMQGEQEKQGESEHSQHH
jgi:hypothetical protein